MRSIYATVVTVLAFSLACAKPGEESDDFHYEQDQCDAYLDCLAAVAPSEIASATSLYGSTSTCWESEPEATRCASACVQASADLFEDHPEEAACAADGQARTLADQPYDWEVDMLDNNQCGTQGSWTATTAPLGDGEFDLTFQPRSGPSIETTCALDGFEFTCDDTATEDSGARVTYRDPFGVVETDLSAFTLSWSVRFTYDGETVDCGTMVVDATR